MRGNIAVVTLLAAGLLVGAGPASSNTAPAPAPDPAGLPEEVTGGVIVDLADGDRFKVTTARNLKTVWGSRYDATAGSWGERSVVFRQKNVLCGGVDARAAGTAVAVIAMCDTFDYAEDRAPTHSQALYSSDTVTWQNYTLPGEAYEEPGISPSGNAAIWPFDEEWVTWTRTGFQVVRRDLPGEYAITATISDAGDASVLYGAANNRVDDCTLQVLTVPTVGPEVRQELPADKACFEVDLVNVDAQSVLFGDTSSPETITTISRPDTASPWAVTGIAPGTAPGLVRHRGRGSAATQFVSSPGLPLLAVGSPDQQTFTAQAYDPAAQRWSEPRQIGRSIPGCTWGDNFIGEPLGVFALRLRCGKKQRVLVSTDAWVWHDVGLNRSPLGVSPDGQYVAASNQTRTLIFSRERGQVRLPLPTRARCDVIQPVSPDTAIRLTTTSKRGWPSVLDESTATGWRRTDTRFPRLRVGTDRCDVVDVEIFQRPISYAFLGRTRGVSLAVIARGVGWKIKRAVY